MEDNKQWLNVLFVVMEFAPINTTGNFRSVKFVKYLSEFGIRPIIVTFEEKSGSKVFNTIIDERLLEDVPEKTPIYRSPVSDLSPFFEKGIGNFIRIYTNIDEGLADRWATPNFWKQLDEVVQKHQPQVIYTSLPPFSAGRLGVKVSKRYNLPLVIDTRDAWSQWVNSPFHTRLHYYLTLKKEAYFLKNASAVIGVTPQLIEDFKRAHPSIERQKFHTITNGYDSPTIKTKNEIIHVSPLANKKKFVIGYVGSFYYSPSNHKDLYTKWWKRKGYKKLYYTPRKENWLYRSPYFFLKTLHQLFKESPHLREKVRFDFVGRKPQWFDDMIDEFELRDVFHAYGFVSHQKALEIQNSFDAFLATSEKVDNGEHYCLPSKIFDYVRKNKPILGFVTKGIQREFLTNIGTGIICEPDNLTLSVQQLRKTILGSYKLEVNQAYLNQYHRRNLSQKLANIIKSVATDSLGF